MKGGGREKSGGWEKGRKTGKGIGGTPFNLTVSG